MTFPYGWEIPPYGNGVETEHGGNLKPLEGHGGG